MTIEQTLTKLRKVARLGQQPTDGPAAPRPTALR
jgi:hypothetical protein